MPPKAEPGYMLLLMMLLEFRVLRRRAVKCDDKSVDHTAMECQIHRMSKDVEGYS